MKLLPRYEALKHCRLFAESSVRTLLVEARAGQGKTALVSQFEADGGLPFFWVNCQDRHRDPSVLYAEVLGVIGDGLSRERLEELRGLLRQQMPPAEVPEKAAIFLAGELNARPGLTLVFDDAHELGESLAGLLLQRLVPAAGEHIRFVLVSRFPVLLQGRPLFPRKDCLVIDNDLLAFSREEIAALYNRHYEVPVDASMVNTQNGMLALNHCRVATVLAMRHAAEGLDLARQGKPWQACGSFESMSGLFHLEGGSTGLEPFPLHGREKILEAFRIWAELQTGCGNSAKALEIVNLGLSLAPASEALQRQRYNLLTAMKRPREAFEGLRRYRTLLEEDGYSGEEISDIIDKIFAP